MIIGLAHVCYTVSDIEKAIEFYTDAIGFTHAFDFENDDGVRTGAYLKAGKGRTFIELFQAGVDGKVVENIVGYQHISIEVEDVRETKEEFENKGLSCTEPYFASDNAWQIWTEDPDGNKIEIHQYTSESKQTPFVDKF